MLLSFRAQAWEDYLYWFSTDRKMCNRINDLVQDGLRHPFIGKGKPEPLRGNLKGFWSRRIDKEHRMVYAVTNEALILIQLRHHY
jgi:toxin YoeB